MTSWGANRLDLFVIGTDSAIFHKAWDGKAWLPSMKDWENLGGSFVFEPASVAWGPNRLDIFAIGTDSALYHKWWDGKKWGPDTLTWENMGGRWTEKPSVVSWSANRLDVFIVGEDRGLYQKYWNGTTWNSGFTNLGGKLLHAPSVVSWGANRIDIFCTGTDSAVYHKWWDGARWGPNGTDGSYENMGGTIVGSPQAVCWGPNRIDIFSIGLNSALYHKFWNGSVWGPSGGSGPWENMGGVCHGTPEVISRAPGNLEVFVLGKTLPSFLWEKATAKFAHRLIPGTDGAVYHKWYGTTGWRPSFDGPFERMGGIVIRDITAVSWAPDRIDMFVIGTAGNIHQKYWTSSSGWQPSLTGPYVNLGGISYSSVAKGS